MIITSGNTILIERPDGKFLMLESKKERVISQEETLRVIAKFDNSSLQSYVFGHNA